MHVMNQPAAKLEVIRDAMDAQGVSQYALADHLNIAQPNVSRRLSGAVDFRVNELRSVASFLSLELADLLPDQ